MTRRIDITVTIGWLLILVFLILFWGSVGILTYRIIRGA
jgi:hypothetical protein